MSTSKSIVTIEIYDVGIQISDGEKILTKSASCVLIDTDQSITVGEHAEHQAYLRPREVSQQFWSDLSGNSTTKHIVSNAELAFHHLQHAWQKANCGNHDVILITPTTYDKQQLGLLLGICEKLSINVVGLVSNAVLAMRSPIKDCKALYLDLLQQNLVITELDQNDNGVALKQPNHNFNFGLQNFIHNCANIISSRFISETRFDPLHIAENEQKFFDTLPVWINVLKSEKKIECKISSDDKYYIVEISQEDIQLANQAVFEEVANYLNVLFHKHAAVAIFCSSSCKKVFGLHEYLSTLPGCAVVQINETELTAHAILCQKEIINDSQILYINSLPWKQGIKPLSLRFNSGKISSLSRLPTHILINNHAYSLQQDLFIANSASNLEPIITREQDSNSLCKISSNNINVEVNIFNTQSISINETKISVDTKTKIGDLLRISGYEKPFRFIKVTQDET